MTTNTDLIRDKLYEALEYFDDTLTEDAVMIEKIEDILEYIEERDEEYEKQYQENKSKYDFESVTGTINHTRYGRGNSDE